MSAENRRFPRFCKRLRVLIGNLELHTTNLSLGGMQLACPGMRMHALEPRLAEGTLLIELEVPRAQTFSIPCRVVYSNKAGDEWLIGLKFEQVAETLPGPLQDYLARLR